LLSDVNKLLTDRMAGILKSSKKQRKLKLSPITDEKELESVSGEAAIYLSDSGENKKEDLPDSFCDLLSRFTLLESYTKLQAKRISEVKKALSFTDRTLAEIVLVSDLYAISSGTLRIIGTKSPQERVDIFSSKVNDMFDRWFVQKEIWARNRRQRLPRRDAAISVRSMIGLDKNEYRILKGQSEESRGKHYF